MPVIIIPMGTLVGIVLILIGGGAVYLGIAAIIAAIIYFLKVILKTPLAIRNKAIANESGLSKFSKGEIHEYIASKLKTEHNFDDYSVEIRGDERVDINYVPGRGKLYIKYRPFTSDFVIMYTEKNDPNYLKDFRIVAGPFLSPNESILELIKFIQNLRDRLENEEEKRKSSQKLKEQEQIKKNKILEKL